MNEDLKPYSPGLFGVCLFALLGLVIALAGTWLYTQTQEISLKTLLFFGHLHPVVLHLPIGALSALFLVEFLSLFLRHQDFSAARSIVLGFTAFSVVVAACTGMLLAGGGGYEGELLEDHKLQGFALAWIVLLAGLCRLLHYRSEMVLWVIVYALLLVSSLAVMSVAGHSGGGMTHGTTFLSKHQPEWLSGLPLGPAPSAETPVAPMVASNLVFQAFAEKCDRCHGAEKQKGDYRMDSREAAMTAGESELPPIVPGEPMKSNLVRLITLLPTHEEVMPPEGKDRLTPEEILAIIHWVEAGAPWPDEEEPGEEPAAQPPVKPDTPEPAPPTPPAAKPRLKPGVSINPAPSKPAAPKPAVDVAEGRVLEGEGLLLTDLDGGMLSVTVRPADAAAFTADALAPHKAKIERLNLAQVELTPEGWRAIGELSELQHLHAPDSNFSDAEVDALLKLGKLEYLNLYGTQIGSEGVKKLVAISSLKHLYLYQTDADPGAADAVRKALPDCSVYIAE